MVKSLEFLRFVISCYMNKSDMSLNGPVWHCRNPAFLVVKEPELVKMFLWFWDQNGNNLSPVCRAAQQPHIFPGTHTGWPSCEAFEGGPESRIRPAGLQPLHCCDEAGTLCSETPKNTQKSKWGFDTSLNFQVFNADLNEIPFRWN